MLLSFLLSALGAIAFASVVSLLVRARTREVDPKGYPVLRYCSAPYVMFVCALAFLAVGVYEWCIPLNHHYSGNLLILSYSPALVGLLAVGMSVHFFTFRATLREVAIQVYRWPLGTTFFNLADLEATNSKGRNTILQFSGNRKFVVYYSYSGRAHFLSTLSANNSSKRTRENPRAT